MSAPPVLTTDAATLTVRKIDISVTIVQAAVDVDDHENLTAREVPSDAPPLVIGPHDPSIHGVDVAGSDEADEATSDDERGTSSSSSSDASEDLEFPEEDETSDVSEHASAYAEHTEETFSNSDELSNSIESLAASVESVEKTVEDGFDLSADQLLWEMLQAGLQPRGGSNNHVVTRKDKTDPIRAAKQKEKLAKKKVEAAKSKDNAGKKVSQPSKA